ncbi:MAG TPA: hypothetical protein VIM16_10005 [Mucilaginibacter sp.]|jgi:hypothetical protein
MSNPLFTLFAELNPDKPFNGVSVNIWAYDLIQELRNCNANLILELSTANNSIESNINFFRIEAENCDALRYRWLRDVAPVSVRARIVSTAIDSEIDASIDKFLEANYSRESLSQGASKYET